VDSQKRPQAQVNRLLGSVFYFPLLFEKMRTKFPIKETNHNIVERQNMLLEKEKVTLGRHDDLLHWIVISGLTEALKGEDFDTFVKAWKGKDKVNIQFLVEGQEIDVEKLCQRWQEQVGRMINKEAIKLLSEKCGKLSDMIYDIEKELTVQAREKLGMEPEEY